MRRSHRSSRATQTELGRLHALDRSTASRNLAMLHKAGWIAFEPTSDGRERIGIAAGAVGGYAPVRVAEAVLWTVQLPARCL